MSLQTPLARARGLGSAKEGSHHWWAQRLTAIALVPLSLWFIYSLVCIGSMDYNTAVEWLQSPVTSVLMILFVVALFYHAQLGIQVVVEDYVRCEVLKISCIILTSFLMLFAGISGVLAILKVFLGL